MAKVKSLVPASSNGGGRGAVKAVGSVKNMPKTGTPKGK